MHPYAARPPAPTRPARSRLLGGLLGRRRGPLPRRSRQPTPVGRAARAIVATVALLATALLVVPPAQADNPVTPGDLTGYGFDQCLAPTQKAMNAWMKSSPYLAVGIYISGNSRACRSQPNLTPTWVSKQLAKGWRLLPITLGPQASCQPRFPRYNDDVKINADPGKSGAYSIARAQGVNEATSAVAAAQALGIVPGSTLWYDLEGFDATKTHCRESALRFLSGWTQQLHALGYVSGVYSSASSGIKMLDDARVQRPGLIVLPDHLWIARWDGLANTSTSYIGEDGWRPGGRMKQYRGGHNETWGGVTINIDTNYLDLGAGSIAAAETHCGGVPVDFPVYRKVGASSDPALAQALQCLLSEQGVSGRIKASSAKTGLPASYAAWLTAQGFPPSLAWKRPHWVALLSAGDRPVLKVGSAGPAVRRVQRALNAAGKPRLTVSGTFDTATADAVKAWQAKVGLAATGIVVPKAWKKLQAGVRKR